MKSKYKNKKAFSTLKSFLVGLIILFTFNFTVQSFGENFNSQNSAWYGKDNTDYANLFAPNNDEMSLSDDIDLAFNEWMSDFIDGVSFYLTLKFMSDLFEVEVNREEMTMIYMLAK